MSSDLTNRWKQLAGSNNWSEQASHRTFKELDRYYSKPDRYYHNWNHIEACLASLDQLQLPNDQHEAIEIALWFHDAIYDTHRKDNEAASAQFAEQALNTLGVSASVTAKIFDLIVATDHQTTTKSEDETLIVDIDLLILASPKDRYFEYSQQIRKEYHWVAEKDYQAGRVTVLESFLKRPAIFRTDFFREHETIAHENIAWEIDSLG